MENKKEIKIRYGGSREYELSKEEMERVIAVASIMLRHDCNFDIAFRDLEEEIEIFAQGHKSKLYGEMKTELIYALEIGLLDNYEQKEEKEEKRNTIIVQGWGRGTARSALGHSPLVLCP